MIVAPRVAYRIFNRKAYNVEELPGGSAAEHMLAKLSHFGLYAFMTVMPATGIAMGYYGTSHYVTSDARNKKTNVALRARRVLFQLRFSGKNDHGQLLF